MDFLEVASDSYDQQVLLQDQPSWPNGLLRFPRRLAPAGPFCREALRAWETLKFLDLILSISFKNTLLLLFNVMGL